MIRYPLQFKASAHSSSGVKTLWQTQVSGAGPLTGAVPPEFSGPGGGYSPEDFYALACLNCYVATFKVLAENSKFVYSEMALEGLLTVDRDERGSPWMSRIDITVHLMGASDMERAKRLLEKTSQSCLVLNSIRTEKSFTFKLQ